MLGPLRMTLLISFRVFFFFNIAPDFPHQLISYVKRTYAPPRNPYLTPLSNATMHTTDKPEVTRSKWGKKEKKKATA